MRTFLDRMVAFSPVLYVRHSKAKEFLFMNSGINPEEPNSCTGTTRGTCSASGTTSCRLSGSGAICEHPGSLSGDLC